MKAYAKRNQALKGLFDTDSSGYELFHSEVNRRIKNSLNTISSILGLQINTLDAASENNTKKILQNSKQRIETIAMNHEALFQNYDTGEVSFYEYVRNLTDMINDSYDRDISVEIESDQLFLPAETMFLIGIILGELFTNSIKYAFEDDKDDDQVKISLLKDEDCFYLVIIESRNENIDIDKILNSQTLGVRLVKLIVKQLNGTLEVTRNRGLIFIINFRG